MNIDVAITSNILGIVGFDKDDYALIGAAVILFGMTHYSVLQFMKNIDNSIDDEALLGETAGSVIDKVKKIYKDSEIKFTGEKYQEIVNDRNKIAHGRVLKNGNGDTFYYYKLKNGEEGTLNKKFLEDFIDNCNLFCGQIVLNDSNFQANNGLFKEKKK